jgi:hypothetical protein
MNLFFHTLALPTAFHLSSSGILCHRKEFISQLWHWFSHWFPHSFKIIWVWNRHCHVLPHMLFNRLVLDLYLSLRIRSLSHNVQILTPFVSRSYWRSHIWLAKQATKASYTWPEGDNYKILGSFRGSSGKTPEHLLWQKCHDILTHSE